MNFSHSWGEKVEGETVFPLFSLFPPTLQLEALIGLQYVSFQLEALIGYNKCLLLECSPLRLVI